MVGKTLTTLFLSTSSARRTTLPTMGAALEEVISIHVLREEDDVLHNNFGPFPQISIHVLREEDDGRSS